MHRPIAHQPTVNDFTLLCRVCHLAIVDDLKRRYSRRQTVPVLPTPVPRPNRPSLEEENAREAQRRERQQQEMQGSMGGRRTAAGPAESPPMTEQAEKHTR